MIIWIIRKCGLTQVPKYYSGQHLKELHPVLDVPACWIVVDIAPLTETISFLFQFNDHLPPWMVFYTCESALLSSC